VSLDLKGVSVPEVMEIMRDVYGYDFNRNDRLFQVFPDVIRTEVFQVDYLNVERSGRSEMQVSAGKVSDARRSNGGMQYVDGDSVSDWGQGGSSRRGAAVVWWARW
jgi:MSHA biogenesis protein MshL